MGIAFQKTCYLVPDSFVKDSWMCKVKDPTRRKLMRRRKKQFDNIFQEALLWSTSMLLPLDIFSERPELYHALDRLSSRRLGQDIDEHKIDRIFRKLSQHILPLGIEQPNDTSRYQQPSYASYETLTRESEADHAPAGALREIYKNCPDFQSKYPNARTWKDIKCWSSPFTINDVFSLSWLDAQYFYAWVNLGLPNTGVVGGRDYWSADNLKEIRARLRSSNSESLDDAYDLQLAAIDCIIVRALPKPHPGGATASLGGENVMGLYPSFFEGDDGWLKDSLRNFLIVPSETDIRGLRGGRVHVVLHELFHSPSVLDAHDLEVKYMDEEYHDKAKGGYLCRTVMEKK